MKKIFSGITTSHSANAPRNDKGGFTLSEVLITLGIIGVVAAITMPTLIKNYKKHVTETRLKQTYSILSQAFYMAQAKYGEFKEWDRANGKTFFDTYWRPYLKVARECKEHGCGYVASSPRIFKRPNGSTYGTGFEYHPKTRYGVVLSNGTFIWFITRTRNSTPEDAQAIYVDINYTQGSNTLGKDVFEFEYTAEGIKPYGYGADESNQKNNCKTIGQFCSSLIMKNGWKIPNDYPVKF